MPFSMLPFAGLIVPTAQFGYPLCCCVAKFWSGKKASDLDCAQWIVYWILCVVLMTLEGTLLAPVATYLPLFQELKLVVLVWLVHPYYQGAAWLWFGHLQKKHKELDDQYYPELEKVLTKIMSVRPIPVAEAAKASDKEEVIADLLTEKK